MSSLCRPIAIAVPPGMTSGTSTPAEPCGAGAMRTPRAGFRARSAAIAGETAAIETESIAVRREIVCMDGEARRHLSQCDKGFDKTRGHFGMRLPTLAVRHPVEGRALAR